MSYRFYNRLGFLGAFLILPILTPFVPLVYGEDFSDLDSTEIKQDEDAQIETTAFDFFIGDSFQGLVPVRYSLKKNEQWLEVIDPKDATELLENVKDKSKVVELLSGRLTGNKFLLDVGSVQFSLDTFNLTIHLEENLLTAKRLNGKDIIAQPEAGFSYRQDFHATSVQADDDYTSVNALSVFSLGRYWAGGDATFTEGEDTQVQNASVNGNWGRYRFRWTD